MVLHPVRLRILGALAGRHLTTKQLAEVLHDVPQATLYRQVRALVQAAMLEVSEQRTVNGIVESTYRLVPGAGRLDRQEFSDLAPAAHLRLFGMFTGAQLIEAQHYFEQAGYDTTREGTTYFRAGLLLTDEEAQRLRVELLALAERFTHEPGPARRMRNLSVSFIPETPRSSTS